MANQINEEDKILSSMMQQLVAHHKKKKKTSTFPHSIHKILFGGGAWMKGGRILLLLPKMPYWQKDYFELKTLEKTRKPMRLSSPCEMRTDSNALCPEQLRFPNQTRKEPRFAMYRAPTLYPALYWFWRYDDKPERNGPTHVELSF